MTSGRVTAARPFPIHFIVTVIALTSMIALFATTSIRAQEVSTITAPQKEAVIDRITAALVESYIFLDVAEEMRERALLTLRVPEARPGGANFPEPACVRTHEPH